MSAKSRRQQIEEMLAEDPNDAFLRYGLAMEYAGAGQDEEAVRELRNLMERDPSYVPAYLQGGQLLARLGQEEEARAVYRAGIATATRQGDAHAAGEMQGFLDLLGD